MLVRVVQRGFVGLFLKQGLAACLLGTLNNSHDCTQSRQRASEQRHIQQGVSAEELGHDVKQEGMLFELRFEFQDGLFEELVFEEVAIQLVERFEKGKRSDLENDESDGEELGVEGAVLRLEIDLVRVFSPFEVSMLLSKLLVLQRGNDFEARTEVFLVTDLY